MPSTTRKRAAPVEASVEEVLDQEEESEEEAPEEYSQDDPTDWVAPTREQLDTKKYRGGGSVARGGVQYHRGAYVSVRSVDSLELGPAGNWLARILSIRADADNDTYCIFAWMYTSKADLISAGCVNPPAKLMPNEVFDSNITDVVTALSIEDHAVVKKFDEEDILQDPILPGEKFHRAVFWDPSKDETGRPIAVQGAVAKKQKGSKRKVKKVDNVPSPRINPYCPPSCICAKPYVFQPMGVQPMVYCPGKDCGTWYHQSCLETMPVTPDLLLTVKSSGEVYLEDERLFGDDPVEEQEDDEDDGVIVPANGIKSDHGLIMSKIELVAGKAIQRGTADYGMVGNGRAVIAARLILQEKDKAEVKLKAKLWHDLYGASVKVEAAPVTPNRRRSRVKEEVSARTTVWKCPSCECPI